MRTAYTRLHRVSKRGQQRIVISALQHRKINSKQIECVVRYIASNEFRYPGECPEFRFPNGLYEGHNIKKVARAGTCSLGHSLVITGLVS